MPLFHRKNPRASWYDYRAGGMYFITTCTQNKEEFFGKIQNGVMIVNKIGEICDEELQIMLQKRPAVEMHEYVIMPNHVHLLFRVDGHTQQTQAHIINQSLGSIIGQRKSAVSKRCREGGYRFVRQTRYYDHIVRDEKAYENIKCYIQNNPQKRDEDQFFILQ